MGADGYSDGSDDNNRDIDNENSIQVNTFNYFFYFSISMASKNLHLKESRAFRNVKLFEFENIKMFLN